MSSGEILVRFRNATGIADSDWLKLAPGISVVTGRNNVGKSRVLKTISDLPAASSNPTQYPNLPQVRVVLSEAAVEADIRAVRIDQYAVSPGSYVVLTTDGRTHYEVSWVPTPQAGGASLDYGPPGGGKSRIVIGNLSSVNGVPIFRNMSFLLEHGPLLSALDRLVYIPPERPVRAAQGTTPATIPSPDGSNLPQVLYHHIGHSTPQATRLREIISAMFPEVEQILAAPTAANMITLRLRDRFAHADISLDDAGTGLARMLHLIACVLIYEPGKPFLIDEPTTHLHPGSEKVLAGFLREHPEHDYVISTHSPIFINAIHPDRAWLMTRDERGSVIQQAFAEQASRGHVFEELGVSPGDVAIAERLLFVEGLTDRLVYPIILNKLGWDLVALNCEVIDLQGAEVAHPLQEAIDQLAKVVSVKYLIYLDGDQLGKLKGKPVKFLPVPEVEDLFLRNPVAIVRGFDEIIAQERPDLVEIWRKEWPVERVVDYLAHIDGKQKGKHVLIGLAHEMKFDYRPAVHGPAITRAMQASDLEDLRADFSELFS